MNDIKKQNAAKAALEYIKGHSIIGVGTGSTTNCFIDLLVEYRSEIEGAVASSTATSNRLKQLNIPIIELNSVTNLPIYIDGADSFNSIKQLVKGGGGALTREKIIATAADKFVCIVDDSKKPEPLGKFPIPIEVIPMARSFVARQLVKLTSGQPILRENFTTDNGNIILDLHNLVIDTPIELEEKINNIPGVVCCGIFAKRSADIIIVGHESGHTII